MHWRNCRSYIRSRKYDRLFRQCIQIGRQTARRTQKSHAVRPRRIERDQNNVRRLRLRSRNLAGSRRSARRNKNDRQQPTNNTRKNYAATTFTPHSGLPSLLFGVLSLPDKAPPSRSASARSCFASSSRPRREYTSDKTT